MNSLKQKDSIKKKKQKQQKTAGVSYKVEEATPSDYTMNATGQEGTMDAEAKTAAFTNTKTGDIDTGVYLDNLPYILVFAGVLAIAAVFIVRRRRFED